MANINYDPFGGYQRLAQAAERIDPRAPEIFAYHAALEAEIDLVLAALLPRPEKLSRLGFGHKISVLGAAWIGEPEAGDKICSSLARFNDLRNAVAHPAEGRIDGCLAGLRAAYREIEPTAGEDVAVAEIAQGICSFIGDGPSPADVERVAAAMKDFVDRYAKAFERIRVEIPTFDIKMPTVDLKIPPIELGLTRGK